MYITSMTVKEKTISQLFGISWTLSVILAVFSHQCQNPTAGLEEDRRVIIVRRECANAAINLNNLFAVCGAGSVDDPFRIVHELQLFHLSDPVNQAVAWDATACNGGRCNFKLIDDLNMAEMVLVGPIGTAAGADAFHANFDGNGKMISNLTINLPATTNVGLFGYIEVDAWINNIYLINVNINGNEDVGGLVGVNNGGSIENSYSTGSVTGGGEDVGGLVGVNNGGSIENSYSTSSVTSGSNRVGGLVGLSTGDIENSYSTGSVSGGNNVGGLVGGSTGDIKNSYSIGSVTSGGNRVGGFVGVNLNNSIENSYSIGLVMGAGGDVGGFVGVNDITGAINGTNYFVDTTDSNGGNDGVGNGTCGPGTCTQRSVSNLRDTLNEGAAPLNWDPAIWGALGEAGSFPCLRNMPSGARSCHSL